MSLIFLPFNFSIRNNHWHPESKCESVVKFRGWCFGLRNSCITLPPLVEAFQVPNVLSPAQVLGKMASFCFSSVPVCKWYGQIFECPLWPLLKCPRFKMPWWFWFYAFAFSFVSSKSSKHLTTNCAGKHITIMDCTICNNDSPLMFIYHKCSLSVSYMSGGMLVGERESRNNPSLPLGLVSSEGRDSASWNNRTHNI